MYPALQLYDTSWQRSLLQFLGALCFFSQVIPIVFTYLTNVESYAFRIRFLELPFAFHTQIRLFDGFLVIVIGFFECVFLE